MKNNSISDNLIYQRKLKGFTQEQLSEESSVTIRTIQRIEKGDVQPHLQTVKLLATGLGIKVEDLMVLDDPKEETIQRKWMLLLHGSPFFGLIIPLANVLFPLFIWISKANDNKIYDEHGRAVVNFHITINVLLLISLLTFFIMPGFNFFFTGGIFLYGIIVSIINVSSALNRQTCKYPLSIPFLKSQKD